LDFLGKSADMGRTKSKDSSKAEKKKAISSTERSQKRRLDPLKRAADNQKRKEARQLKGIENPLSAEELENKRKADRLRKAKSRLNQSRQKKVGSKVKDRNRKCQKENIPTSTERVQKHRQNLIKFNFSNKRQRVEHAAQSMNRRLSVLSPLTKRKAVTKVCQESLSPSSRQGVANEIQDGDPLVNFTNTISKRRDKISNCTRRLVLGNIVKRKGNNWQETRRANRQFNWTSLMKASEKEINQVIKHYKTVPYKTKKPPTETMKKVFDFYNRDEISRQLPYKNMTRKVKDHLGVYHRVPMRVLEVTLRSAFLKFKSENEHVKICNRTFEQLRPKHIRLRRFAQRLQCCCTYHTNIDYLRKAVNNIFLKNNKEIPFRDNKALISSAKIDAMEITSLKCSNSCFEQNNDCSDHTVKVHQFERVTYMYKGKEMKKLQLVDKMIKISELIALLKLQLQRFPMHRFNVQHTAETFDSLISNLNETSIIKIHDFSENYTCLLPEEIQSLHWVQQTATVYPIVVMRRVGADVREDHIVFISDNKKHDVSFVEKCNEILHHHYAENGIFITHDIEYNDGCASQFKCIRAFSSLARIPVKTTRIFCDTSHGKSKYDGLGGVVKSFATCAVCGERRIIRNAEELTNFFNETLVVKSAIESNHPMLNRMFFLITSEEMDNYRATFPSLKHKFIPGTIHQVVTMPGNEETILYRKGCCGCSPCLHSNYRECVSLTKFKDHQQFITMTKYVFSAKGEARKATYQDYEEDALDLDEDEQNEWEEMFVETEASKHIQQGDIAVIKTGDDHPYYLLKVTSPLFVTEFEMSDDYRHTFPPAHRVIEGHYLEIFKETNCSSLYYINDARKALISAFSIVGNCQLPTRIQKKGAKI